MAVFIEQLKTVLLVLIMLGISYRIYAVVHKKLKRIAEGLQQVQSKKNTPVHRIRHQEESAHE